MKHSESEQSAWEDQLEAWLDGNLPEAETEIVETRLLRDPKARSDLQRVMVCRGLSSWAMGTEEEATTDGCRACRPLLGRYIKGMLDPSQKAQLSEHLAECVVCEGTYRSIEETMKARRGRRIVRVGVVLLVLSGIVGAAAGGFSFFKGDGNDGKGAREVTTRFAVREGHALSSHAPGWPEFPGTIRDREAILAARIRFSTDEGGGPVSSMLAEVQQRLGPEFLQGLEGAAGATQILDQLDTDLSAVQRHEMSLLLYLLEDRYVWPKDKASLLNILEQRTRTLPGFAQLRPLYADLAQDPRDDGFHAHLLRQISHWDRGTYDQDLWRKRLRIALERRLPRSVAICLGRGVLHGDSVQSETAFALLAGQFFLLPLKTYSEIALKFLWLSDGGDARSDQRLLSLARDGKLIRARAGILDCILRHERFVSAEDLAASRRSFLALHTSNDAQIRNAVAWFLATQATSQDLPLLKQLLVDYSLPDAANSLISTQLLARLKVAQDRLH